MQIKKQLNLRWNNRLVPNWERSTSGCILSPCLFYFYAEYIMQNARLDEAQVGIKVARRNINTSDVQMTPTLWQKKKEDLKSLLMKVKEESE